MNALLLSASKVGDSEYLEHTLPIIGSYLTGQSIKTAVFIPYAGVTISYDDYTTKVSQALSPLPFAIKGIHEFASPLAAIEQAELIIVGGGNTFELLHQLYQQQLLTPIRNKIQSGTPYIGWSAGSNIAGQSIRTTNDMPIVQPASFDALAIVPFQLNPHYTDYQPPGHHGETRQMRIEEFMVLNPNTPVVGIQEGTALQLSGDSLTLVGDKPGYLFLNGEKTTILPQQDLANLLA